MGLALPTAADSYVLTQPVAYGGRRIAIEVEKRVGAGVALPTASLADKNYDILWGGRPIAWLRTVVCYTV